MNDISTNYDGVFYRELRKMYQGKPDRSFYIRYRIGNTPKNEKIGKASEGFNAKKASMIRAERLVAIRHGEDPTKKRDVLVGSLAKRYFEEKDHLVSTREDQYRYDKHLSCLNGRIVKDLSAKDFKPIHRKILESGKDDDSFLRVYQIFNKILNYSLKNGYINDKPKIHIEIKSRKKKVTEIFTDEMIDKWLDIVINYSILIVRDIMLLLYYTGMRRSEPLGLLWKDYDPLKGSVTIRDAKSGQDEIKYLGNEAKAVIERQRGRSKKYIFVDETNNPLKKGKLSYHATKIRDRAGFPDDFRPLHSLRHNFGTKLAENGANPFEIKEMLNHKDVKTTQRYIDIAENRKQDIANSIEHVLKR